MSFFSKSKSNVTIPDREESAYCGQYSHEQDVDRLIEIFQDSAKLAMESRNPETAHSRYELLIESYHQLKSLSIGRTLRKNTDSVMEDMVSTFPSQVCVNEALGLCDKANKVKTIKTQYKYLKKAEEVLRKGLEEINSDKDNEKIIEVYEQVNNYLKQVEDQIENN